MFLQLGRLHSEIKAAEAWEEFGVSVATSPRSWVPVGSVLAHNELQKVAEGAWLCAPTGHVPLAFKKRNPGWGAGLEQEN